MTYTLHAFILKCTNYLGAQYPWLGQRTRDAVNTTQYMSILSRGWLHMPSESFIAYLEKFEARFKNLHEDTVYRQYDPIGTLTALLEVEFKDVPVEILGLFSKARFFIRLKKLNLDVKSKKKGFKRRHAKFMSKLT